MGEEEERKQPVKSEAPQPAKETFSFDHVFQAWSPAHPATLALIKDRIRKGEYRTAPEKLCDDIKGDVSLFMHCIKHVKTSNDALNQSDTPVGLLRNNLQSNVNHLFGLSERKISQHGFTSIDKPQAQAMKHALLSCSTSEIMARTANIDPDLVFSIGAFREFAMNLVSWNYPRIYSRALTKSGSGGESLDINLAKGLGFPPRNLALKLARDWGLNDEMLKLISAITVEDSKVVNPTSICEAGEIFASAHDPDLQRSVASRWADVTKRIDHIFGPGGMEKLRAQVSEKISHYTVSDPGRFSLELPKAPSSASTNIILMEEDLLFQKNQYARRCPDTLQVLFQAVYRKIPKNQRQSSPVALQELISAVVPHAGFSRGCMFLADTTTLTLVPKLRIGDSPITRYSNAHGVSRAAFDELRQSFLCSSPISRRGQVMFGDVVSFVCGAIKKGQLSGVLYLELIPEFEKRAEEETQLYFRAIRQCFADCIEPGI